MGSRAPSTGAGVSGQLSGPTGLGQDGQGLCAQGLAPGVPSLACAVP